MSNILNTLRERGFIQQTTHDKPLADLLEKRKITFYIGFDPTADSLHVGSVLPIMAMAHMQSAGHRPIVLLGGGTAMIGDPSGKTEMRKMMTEKTIRQNAECFKGQIGRYLDFSGDKAVMVDNADWLLPLKYIEFLREIGVHFSVNRMLTAECFRQRLEKGLSFIEFNYMLLQAYDFLHLFREYKCMLQMGGDDQWSNILSGADLVRRMEQTEVYGVTFPLLTTSAGRKMGKTEAGAVWLDAAKTSPYEFYQYWRNTHDNDVEKFLALYTFLPMTEVKRLGALKDKELNEAKKILAFEATRLAHGEAEAVKARQAAEALFGGAAEEGAIPATEIPAGEFGNGVGILDLLLRTGLAPSKSEARRLVEQGGVSVDDEAVDGIDYIVAPRDRIMLRKGKKTYHMIRVL
ncbi:MAG: tyrosine--tRNA ligase [Bacillota bacterium]